MKVDILICTCDKNIEHVSDILLSPVSYITYKVAHQISDVCYQNVPKSLCRPDVIVGQYFTCGLSNNRNHALKMATADICFIADDDVRYELSFIDEVVNIFNKKKKLDVLVGKIQTNDSELPFKRYSNTSYKLNIWNVGSVSSIEIVVRRKSIIEKGIFFDNRFGLNGLLYNKGEEVVFLSDCLKRKLDIKYEPIFLVKHPYYSTGKMYKYDEVEAEYYGALLKRMLGVFSCVLVFVLLIKHYNRYRRNIGVFSFIVAYYKGMKQIKN